MFQFPGDLGTRSCRIIRDKENPSNTSSQQRNRFGSARYDCGPQVNHAVEVKRYGSNMFKLSVHASPTYCPPTQIATKTGPCLPVAP
jgi:hypothetical protein